MIYYFAALNDVFYMLDIYAKNEMEDLPKTRIRELRAIVSDWLEK